MSHNAIKRRYSVVGTQALRPEDLARLTMFCRSHILRLNHRVAKEMDLCLVGRIIIAGLQDGTSSVFFYHGAPYCPTSSRKVHWYNPSRLVVSDPD